jgi:ribosomal subunit interface protein
MNTTFTVRHLENNDIIKGTFEDRAVKLKEHLKRFKDDLTYLHGTLEKNPHKDEFYATLSLFLPSVALHCREQGGDYAAALNTAFSDIVRQLEKHIDKLNREKRRRVR